VSDQDAPTHEDPLAALRAQDHRPRYEVWRHRAREQIEHRLVSRDGPGTFRRVALGLLAVPVAIGFGWQAYTATEPPVEDSIAIAAPPDQSVTTLPIGDAPVEVQVSAGSEPVDAPGDVVVHVAGAVRNPGLIVGEPGWRVNDAVIAAGGATVMADLDRMNLAASIVDGERLFVPTSGEDAPAVVISEGDVAAESAPLIVDLNTADERTLESLPGVGPVTASTIVAHRGDHGPFATVDALVAVRGIGPATLEELRDHVTVQ